MGTARAVVKVARGSTLPTPPRQLAPRYSLIHRLDSSISYNLTHVLWVSSICSSGGVCCTSYPRFCSSWINEPLPRKWPGNNAQYNLYNNVDMQLNVLIININIWYCLMCHCFPMIVCHVIEEIINIVLNCRAYCVLQCYNFLMFFNWMLLHVSKNYTIVC